MIKDHHDAAYRWAEQRKLERHPTTGAAQLVEVRETVREIELPRYVDVVIPAPTSSTDGPARHPFADIEDDELLGYGVPTEWIDDVRGVTEASLFDVLAHLPSEAAEALLEVATGGTPRPRVTVAADEDAFAHPDAQRHFAVMSTAEQLQRALDAPWDTWAVFLHPDQRDLVERRFSGPARVSGSAGTGKTIVALHRAVYLTRAHAPRVLQCDWAYARSLDAQKKRRTRGSSGSDSAGLALKVAMRFSKHARRDGRRSSLWTQSTPPLPSTEEFERTCSTSGSQPARSTLMMRSSVASSTLASW